MSPDPALLSSSPQRRTVVEQRDCGAAKRDMVTIISAFRIDRRQVPKRDRELCVCWKRTIMHRQSEPLIPYTGIFEVLVWCLGVDGERFRIGEGLDGHVELGNVAEVAAAMPQIGSAEECGIG